MKNRERGFSTITTIISVLQRMKSWVSLSVHTYIYNYIYIYIYIYTVCPESPFLKAFDNVSSILLYYVNYSFLNDRLMHRVFSYRDDFCKYGSKVFLPAKWKNLILFLFEEEDLRIHRPLNLLSIHERLVFE